MTATSRQFPALPETPRVCSRGLAVAVAGAREPATLLVESREKERKRERERERGSSPLTTYRGGRKRREGNEKSEGMRDGARGIMLRNF